MNKRTVIANLNKIANELDNNGLYKEANTVTKVMSRLAMDENDEYNMDDYGICPDCSEPLDNGMCQDCGYGEDEDYSGNGLTEGLDEISSMMDMHGNHPADKLREDYSRDYNNPSRSEMGNVFRDLDELVQESMTMNSKQRERYEEIKKQIIDGYGDDDDMGPESEPFDYSSPEDEGYMYGDDMSGYMDKDTDF